MGKLAKAIGNAAVIDVETTGFDARREQIIELAITLFRYDRVSGRVLDIVRQYSGMREPSCRISRRASAIHGITLRMMRGHHLDYRIIRAIFQEADFLVAHNAEFDRRFVERLMPSARNRKWLCSMKGVG